MPITSSFISSSDASLTGEGSWQGFAVIWVSVALALSCALLITAFAVDPYDTGRSTLFAKPGVRPQGPRTAGASRGRDPAFNAAIIGNSHIQLLSPERLSAATGLAFVQLSIPATRPKEQFVLIEWFARHHPELRALVIGADNQWCTGDPALPNDKPFPFWLYSHNPMEYLRGLSRYATLEEVPRRLAYVLSRRAPRARPDGYWDYEAAYVGMGYAGDPAIRARLQQPLSYINNGTGRFPAIEKLEPALASLPAAAAVVIVFPPVYAPSIASEGNAAQQAGAACKEAFAKVASERPRTAVVDWRVDRPETRDPELFFDQTHYRQPLARLIEADIAAALARTGRAP